MKYLFSEWSTLNKKLKNRQIFLLLDYDGTLCPIAKTPEKAVIPIETKTLLNKLSKTNHIKIAIISGRSLSSIKKMIEIENIIYSGNHGMEMEGPRMKFTGPLPSMYKRNLRKIKNELQKSLLSYKGVLLEDKGISLSIHYRMANQKDIPLIKEIFNTLIYPYVNKKLINITLGKMVFEIRPHVQWDKGKISVWLLSKQHSLYKRNEFFPIYMGDDVTDEDAFKAIRDIGWTIYVGKPKKSYAEYYVKNTNEVSIFLKELLVLKGDLSRPFFGDSVVCSRNERAE